MSYNGVILNSFGDKKKVHSVSTAISDALSMKAAWSSSQRNRVRDTLIMIKMSISAKG
jgi:hypothetical protein